jgi:PKD repeat protein
MKRFLICAAWAVLLGLAMAPFLSATITHTPSLPNADQSVHFQLVTTAGVILFTIEWDFGDGTGASGVMSVNKTYRSAGTFHVKCSYHVASTGLLITEDTSVTVVENRRITYTPAVPQVNQAVSFQAVNFLSASIRWDFGDGTPPGLGGTAMTHTYSTPGTFQVRAWDLGGTSPTAITATVTISLDISRRRIQCSPSAPNAGLPVTFTALGFFTADIRWDFGDGTPPLEGTVQAVHTYAAPGNYVVRAWDWDGRYGDSTSLSITVNQAQAATGPGAAFQVAFLQLRFEDGKAYTVVPKDFPGLKAFADIKYEGTGLLRVQWLVDGSPFGMFITRALAFAADTVVDSGTLPGLPTIMPGMHEVSLRIFDPAVDFTVPVIRYFVSADSAVRPQDLRGVQVGVETVRGLDGLACTVAADGLEIPAGRYVILNGFITYDLPKPVKFALLRVHLEDQLIDQQFLTDLKPGDKRAFSTSLRNPTSAAKKLYVTVYDLDGQRAELIFFQKMMIYAAEK